VIRLRQICLVAADRDTVVGHLESVFSVRTAFEDPGVATFGLHNAVIPVGGQFLEVVAPVREGTTAGRYLQRRGGDGGYMLIFQSDDQESHRTRIFSMGWRIVTDFESHGYRCMQVHPADSGGTFLEIDRQDPWDDWHPAGPQWRDHVDTRTATGFAQADVGCTDPADIAARWGAAMDLPVTIGRNCGMHKVRPEGFCVRFTPAGPRGEGLDTVEVKVRDTDEVIERSLGRGLPVHDGAVTIGGVAFVPVQD
jgi:hypothetical protein